MGTNRRDVNTFISRRGLINLYKRLQKEDRLGSGGLRRLEELTNRKGKVNIIDWYKKVERTD